MGFRIIHHEGSKELLLEKVKAKSDEVKNHEEKDCFDTDEWDHAVDSILNDDLSSSKFVPIVLAVVINDSFQPISEDFQIGAYKNLLNKISGKLAETLLMFENGRSFSTGNSGFGDEITCGYLTADEVKEFLGLIKAYTPDSTCEGEKELVDDLISTFSTLDEKKTGDLFTMS
jgi:hypothetical protein